MSDFANMLKKRADESGRVTVQGVTEGTKTVEKANDKSELAGMFAKHKKESAIKREVTNALVSAGAPRTQDNVARQPLDVSTQANGLVNKWSMSRIHNYETCPYTLHQSSIDKIKTPSGPQAARGTDIHDMCEAWVRGEVEHLKGDRQTNMAYFRADFEKLKRDFIDGKVELEGDWGLRRDWSPCGFFDDDVWGRVKLDAFVRESPTSCLIIDYKTGRKYGNEIKHGEQGLGYAIAAAHRHPELDHFRVEFWYLDQSEKRIQNFRRSDLMVLLPRLNNRAVKQTTDTLLRPTPSEKSCKWCSYGCNTNKDGRPYGVGSCEFDYFKGYEVL